MDHCTVCGAPMPPGETICGHCGRAHYGSTCERCKQPAPTIIRGGQVICSGCGAVRGPLAGVPLNLVGSAHRVGGVLSALVGWMVILGGLALGGVFGLTFWLVGAALHLFANSALVGALVGLGIGGITGAFGALALFLSRRLRERAGTSRDEAMEQSILAMAANRNGAVTTVEVAQNLSIPLRDADRLLTDMSAKGRAQVEVNREGLLQYAFRDIRPSAAAAGTTGLRIETASPAEAAKETVDREFEELAAKRREGRL